MMLGALKKKIRSILVKVVLHKPVPYSSSLVLNVLGFQVYRTFFLYLWRLVRRPFQYHLDTHAREYLVQLRKDGVAVIPNFFSDEDYTKIKEEFETLSSKFPTSYSAIMLPHVERMHADNPLVSDFFRDSFCNNPVIHSVSTAYLGCRYNLPIDPNLTNIHCDTEAEIQSPKNGGTNNLHIDAPVRTLKIFYYVTDTKKENAAFKYCIGSNSRMSLKRLWLEYILSIRYAMNKGNPNHNGEYADDEPWVVVTKEEMEKHGLIETDVEVRGNTLVFADTGGFHRRGECLSKIPRKTVEISFRSIDTIKNAVLPIVQKVAPSMVKPATRSQEAYD